MSRPLETALRREALLKAFPRLKIDGLLVTALPNIRYLCGFTGSNGALLLTHKSAILFTDPRYTVQATAEVDCKVRIVKGPLMKALAIVLMKDKLARIGFEADRITFAQFADLKSRLAKSASLKPIAHFVDELRMIKSTSEIESIRRSVQTNSQAFEAAIKSFKAAMTELELASEIEWQMRRYGAERPAFETIVASGSHSALPHASPRNQAIQSNRLLLIDIGALQAGYTSDMTRTLQVGDAGKQAKQVYRAVLEAQLSAIDFIKPGVTAGKVDAKARSVLKQHGFAESFVHSTGHGLGLEIHEAPRLGRRDPAVLQAGMVLTVEPGAYLQDFGGVRIEDTIEVTAGGCAILTPTRKEFISL